MRLIKSLKLRPLKRDKVDSLRDDRLFIVACDDTYAPDQYFYFFKIPRVQVHVVPTAKDEHRCHAIDVLQRLETFEYEEDDERWMLLDTDHYVNGPHIKEFNRIIKEAEEKGISVALSKPCFELWLLLHHADNETVTELVDANAVERALRGILGEYNKKRLKREHYPLEAVVNAYIQAKALDEIVNGGRIPQTNTTRVYQLLESIVAKALSSELHPELAALQELLKRMRNRGQK